MKKRSGFYPVVGVDAAGSGVVSLVAERCWRRPSGRSGWIGVVRGLGAVAEADGGACPAKVLCDLAVALALGGDCLADVALLREEPGV